MAKATEIFLDGLRKQSFSVILTLAGLAALGWWNLRERAPRDPVPQVHWLGSVGRLTDGRDRPAELGDAVRQVVGNPCLPWWAVEHHASIAAQMVLVSWVATEKVCQQEQMAALVY